jgi:very-short-patch-repair endonuclease
MAGELRHVGRERRLAELATLQHGVVGLTQLTGLGFGTHAIEGRLRDGRLHHVHRQAYAVGHLRLTQRSRWWAAVLAYGEGTVLSHRSAAALWRLTGESGPIDVTASRGRQGVERRPGIFLHRCRLSGEGRTLRDGIPVTTVGRTLFDLAEVERFPRLRHAWEEADRLDLLQLDEVERVCEAGRGRRALRPIRLLLDEARAPTVTRSPLEDRFAAFCRDQRLPEPATNVLLLGHEVDAYWPAAHLAVELDSVEFHMHRAAFERDRARDAALQAAGYRTVRITDRRLKREPDRIAAELRRLLVPT